VSNIQQYAKFLVAILGAAFTASTQAFPDNSVIASYGPLVLSVLTAIAVYAVPNKPDVARHAD
jgi:hypothetical protein